MADAGANQADGEGIAAMTNQSTPRCDAATCDCETFPGTKCTSAEVARTLERELAQARTEVLRMKGIPHSALWKPGWVSALKYLELGTRPDGQWAHSAINGFVQTMLAATPQAKGE